MNINELLSGLGCSCGKKHTVSIKYVYVESEAVSRLVEILAPYNKILVVADENTYGAAGDRVEKYLGEKIRARQIFSGKELLIPNEDAIEATEKALSDCDFILAVGSGSLQDLCKYVSHVKNIPYAVVATAPSMDGYASNGAAMILGGMKVTVPATLPLAIICDTEVMRNAPIEMIKAGYGDIIGKYSALNDWKLSRTVNGEYFCDYIYNLTLDMVKETLPLAERLLSRDKDSIRILSEALVVVGILMSFATSSRPASGSEHHLSHYFEITGIIEGREYLPHGIDVLYSTYVTALVREKLLSVDYDREGFVMEKKRYESEMRRVYRRVSDGCILLQNKMGRYEVNRMNTYKAKEKEIKEILREMPSSREIAGIIEKIGLSVDDFYSVYSKEVIDDAIKYAKDLKDRYTVLWMYYDVFGLEEVNFNE